jgi:hypothetical protein
MPSDIAGRTILGKMDECFAKVLKLLKKYFLLSEKLQQHDPVRSLIKDLLLYCIG